MVGCHAVYKIEDVSMIYIPATGPSTNPDEMRYAKLFQVSIANVGLYGH